MKRNRKYLIDWSKESIISVCGLECEGEGGRGGENKEKRYDEEEEKEECV